VEIYVNHLPILIYGPPQVALLAIDSDKDFIDVESITVSSVLSLQSSGI